MQRSHLDKTGGQDVAILFATRVGLVVLGLLIQGMLAYTLLPEGRGSYAVCVVFGTLLGLLFTPGAQQGTQHFVMTGEISVSQGVSSALMISLAGGGLAIALAIPMVHSDLAFFQKAETHTFYLALVLVPLTAFSVAIEHQLAALRCFGRLAVASLLRMLVNLLAILFLVWDRGLGVDGAILSFAASHLVLIAACLRDLRRNCGLAPAMPFRSSLCLVLGYGLRYHIARIGDGIGPHVGVLVLGLIASPAEIGLFSAASTLMLGFMLISNSVGNALLPRIAGIEYPELVTLCLRLVCGATGAALLALLAISMPLVRLLLSEVFLQVVPLIWIIAPGTLAHACLNMFMTYFKGINRPGVCSWAVFLGIGVNFVALFLLYPKLGVEAAAWAMTIGMLCRCLLLAIIFRNTTRLAWRSIWLPRRGDATFLWAAGRSVLGRWTFMAS